MTTFDVLAESFPLHFQRICEAAHEQYPYWADEYLRNPPDERDAGLMLSGAFIWEETTEGHAYWQALADGVHCDS